MCTMEWETVFHQHSTLWPNETRTNESLKRKFQKLRNKKIPTGDPNCPPDVRRAKQIYVKLVEKTEMSNGSEDEVDLEEQEDENADDDDNDSDNDTPRSLTPTAPPSTTNVEDNADRMTMPVVAATIARPSSSFASLSSDRDDVSSSGGSGKRRRLLNSVSNAGSRKRPPPLADNDTTKAMFEMIMLQRQQERAEDRERDRLLQERQEERERMQQEREERQRQQEREREERQRQQQRE